MSKKKPAKKASGKKPSAKQSGSPQPLQKFSGTLKPEILDAITGEPDEISDLQLAQEFVYDAWEAPNSKQAVKLAEKALALSEDCADAWLILAEKKAKTPPEALDYCRKALATGEREIEREGGFKNLKGRFWGFLETRPYMRARQMLADILWESGAKEEAIGHYSALLELNPDDNQGIRDFLFPRLIGMGRDREACDLYERYRNEMFSGWTYNFALLQFRAGKTEEANRALRDGISANPHVPDYLLCRRELPKNPPEFHGIGDKNEAVVYVAQAGEAWIDTPGALEWLAERVPE